MQGNIPLPQDPQGAPNHTKLSDLISKVPAGPSSSQRSKGQTLTAVLSRHCRAFRDKGDVHTCMKKSCSGGQAHVQQGYNPGADGHLKPQCFVLRAGHASFTLPFPLQQVSKPCIRWPQNAHEKSRCWCCWGSSVWVSATVLIRANEFTECLQHDSSSCSRSQGHSPATQ